jgi:hypothetical protein
MIFTDANPACKTAMAASQRCDETREPIANFIGLPRNALDQALSSRHQRINQQTNAVSCLSCLFMLLSNSGSLQASRLKMGAAFDQ